MREMKLSFILVILFTSQLKAQITSIVGPIGSGDFGYSVTALSNGNYVITDPYIYNGAIANAGAVYLYDGRTHSLISTLKGAKNDDFIGRDGVFALPNGNFVVLSHSADNGSVVNCGAITWVNGVSGLSGEITTANTLYGTATNDSLGSGDTYGVGRVVVFDNSNYAVVSPGWDNGSAVDAGAVTLLNGNGPTTGVISSANSLVGSSANDRVGSDGILLLDNNHFIVRSFGWNNGPAVSAGAITWCNGVSLTGQVSSGNSLVGTTTGDFYDDITTTEYRIIKLSNGNFVVSNPKWDDPIGGVVDAGAVTWGSNSLGLSGIISSSNSLVGHNNYEMVGSWPGLQLGGVVALSNGNYVVSTPGWLDEFNSQAGAVTWGNGNTGTIGTIDATNSLVGFAVQDNVGSGGIVPLTNGNYVVLSPYWSNGANEYIGAITWGNGSTGTTGQVSTANSLVGTTFLDFETGVRVTPLSNGNYVISIPNWDDGSIANAGAVTWANGYNSITGEINSSTSLIGTNADDQIGYNVAALTNGNYVVISPYWDNGVIVNAGAVTWANGTTGITGFVNDVNSLVGTQANDQIGIGGGLGYSDVTVLNNGNYVVGSPYWDNGSTVNAGASTWANGITGITGPVNSSNSLVGTTTGARVSSYVTALTNGNYVVSSPLSDVTSLAVGALTWGNGNSGITGPVTTSNSLLGNSSINPISNAIPLPNGNYLAISHIVVGSPGTWPGSVTWGNGSTGTIGIVNSDNSLLGGSPNDNIGDGLAALTNNYYVVWSMQYDNGTNTDAGAVTLGNISSGVAGVISNCNSILGQIANNGWKLAISQSDDPPYVIVGQALHNVVYILQPVSATLVASNDSATVSINGNTPVALLNADGCHLIAKLTPQGANPVKGTLKAKIWNETAVPVYNGEPFVSRHYEITPALNTSVATARVTLYFTQQDFDDFNAHPGSTLNTPVDQNDVAGIANVRIGKYAGTSNDGTGLPETYTGTFSLIDPADNDIVWNNTLLRWEISFDVTGFSGFILQTNAAALPLTLLEFKGRLVNDDAILNWKTTDELNTASFDIERSIDGRSFIKVGNMAAMNQPGIHHHSFNDNHLAALGTQLVYYRLKLVDIDGRFTYSGIVMLTLDNKITVSFYPNPAKGNATLAVTFNAAANLQVRIIDNTGRTVSHEQLSLVPGNNTWPIQVNKLSKGIYFLELKGKDFNHRIRFIKM